LNETPLHLAALNGHLSCVSVLLASGADTTAATQDGSVVQHQAALSGNADLVALLQKSNIDFSIKDNHGVTPFLNACLRFFFFLSFFFLWFFFSFWFLSFCCFFLFSICSGDINTVNLFIEKGEKIDQVDNDGNTPLLAACQSGKFF
jgi:ankyrin repeat protein